MTRPCSPSQEAFARGVASGLSQAEAYRRAYPRSQKWKADAVHQAASRLMGVYQVSARVKELQGLAAEAAVLDKAKVLREVAMLAHSDIAGIVDENGRIKLPNELDPVTRAAVKSFKIDEDGRIEYQFWDKRASLDMAMKHLGLYELDNKQKVDPLAELLGTLKGNVVGPVAQEGKG
ncbi:hypothetical protein CS062_17495 [Roseateles chitinivorans]|uniref:Terminase small subunit n=1 Tax=Roseateles chitinivorans TaxID=2917965 RepID=A0A2G9C8P5_9BURK|nr:terminase small subunit [Roseateles chitinivorans]PIM51919.1 hypothetical protein CS062_17495 [Roseateles chitinivorans]